MSPLIHPAAGTGISFYGQPSDDLQMNYTYDDSRLRPIDADFTRGITGKVGLVLAINFCMYVTIYYY